VYTGPPVRTLVRIQRDAYTHLHGFLTLTLTNLIATTLRTHFQKQSHNENENDLQQVPLSSLYISTKKPPLSLTHYTTNKHKTISSHAPHTSPSSSVSHPFGNTTSPNSRNNLLTLMLMLKRMLSTQATELMLDSGTCCKSLSFSLCD
jgi:hypothetical protein